MQGASSFLSFASVPMATNPQWRKEHVGCLISSRAGKHFIIALKLSLHIAEVLILHNYRHDSCDLRLTSCEVECSVCDDLKDESDFPDWLVCAYVFSVNIFCLLFTVQVMVVAGEAKSLKCPSPQTRLPALSLGLHGSPKPTYDTDGLQHRSSASTVACP